MSEKPIGPLRRRMIEDMIMRNFVEKTRNDYIGNRSSALAAEESAPNQSRHSNRHCCIHRSIKCVF